MTQVYDDDKDEEYKCDICKDTGFISYTKYHTLKPGYPYAFASKCSCNAGYKLSPRIPFYHALAGHEKIQEHYQDQDEPKIFK